MKGFKESMKSGGRGKTGKGPKFKYSSIKHGVTETETDEMEEGWFDTKPKVDINNIPDEEE